LIELSFGACSELVLGYNKTPLSLDKLLEHPDQSRADDEYLAHGDEKMWFRSAMP